MNGLFALALLHLAALAMPGPDYFLVSRYAILKSRQHALAASLGIALGILAHVMICVTGLSFIILQWPATLTIIKILGALYLFYLGFSGLRQEYKKYRAATQGKNKTPVETPDAQAPRVSTNNPPMKAISDTLLSACGAGFFTNLLNPKVILFFTSLLTAFLPVQGLVQFGILAAIQFFALTLSWFTMVALVLSRPSIQVRAQRFQSRLEVATGIAFMCLGAIVLVTPTNL